MIIWCFNAKKKIEEKKRKKKAKELVIKPLKKKSKVIFNLDKDATFFKLFDYLLFVNNVDKKAKELMIKLSQIYCY